VQNAALPEDGSQPLTGEAFKAAERAYQAYNAKDYENAAKEVKTAIALRPDVLRLYILLSDSLDASGQYTDAYFASADAAKRFGDSEPLRLRRQFIGSRLAQQMSARAMEARQSGDLATTIRLGKQAVNYAPEASNYGLQLYEALLEANDWNQMIDMTSQAIAYDDTDVLSWAMRGYARFAKGDVVAAQADFDKTVKITETSEDLIRTADIIVADVYLAQDQPQRALDLLAPLKMTGDYTDPLVADRRHRGRLQLSETALGKTAVLSDKASVAKQLAAIGGENSPSLSEKASAARLLAGLVPVKAVSPSDKVNAARPVIFCEKQIAFGVNCEAHPADRGFNAANSANRAIERNDFAQGVTFAKQAVALAPNDPQHRLTLIDALNKAGDEKTSAQEARNVIADGLLDGMVPLTAAYTAQAAGDQIAASNYFLQADQDGTLTTAARADAAFSAIQAHRNQLAATYLEQVIDSASASGPDADDAVAPKTLQDARQAHADITRHWGFDATLSYRGGADRSQSITSTSSSVSPVTNDGWQASAELNWRPFGSLGDRSFELYARGSENIGASGGNASGAKSLQVALGARAKPFASIDAIVAFEHIIGVGSEVKSDWLARLAYSAGFGTERRIDVPSWWTAQGYAEAGHYFEANSNYATGNFQAGRSYRIDSISSGLVLFPHVVVGADYDSSLQGDDSGVAVGSGVGLNMRYWFRDSKYDAYRSFLDATLQYRFGITGDDRARGVFFNTTFSY
jgi:tetratricopeptide (TPR) repeat protein